MDPKLLHTGSWKVHVNKALGVDMSLKQTLYQLQFCAKLELKRERFQLHVNAALRQFFEIA